VSTPPVVTQMLAESGLSDEPQLTRLLGDLHALGDVPAPAPAPELTELLGATPAVCAPPAVAPLRRRVVGGATALAFAAVAATGMAAAANELPSGAQRVMARFSERFLPFAFPAPAAGRGPASGADAGDAPAPANPAPVPTTSPPPSSAAAVPPQQQERDGQQGMGQAAPATRQPDHGDARHKVDSGARDRVRDRDRGDDADRRPRAGGSRDADDVERSRGQTLRTSTGTPDHDPTGGPSTTAPSTRDDPAGGDGSGDGGPGAG
jgi:hypothetical protein